MPEFHDAPLSADFFEIFDSTTSALDAASIIVPLNKFYAFKEQLEISPLGYYDRTLDIHSVEIYANTPPDEEVQFIHNYTI